MFVNINTHTTKKSVKHSSGVFFSLRLLNSRKRFVCVVLFLGGGGVKGGKHEGRIIKNVNWLHKNELCMCFSLLPTLHPPACRGSTYQHEEKGGGGSIRIKTT